MNNDKIKWGAKALLFGITAVAVFSLVVMLLWNWLIPSLFGLTTISYLQAMGLLVLSKILFSGFGRGGGGRHMHQSRKSKAFWGEKFREKMEKMTPDEREAYKEKFMNKCGGKFRNHPAWRMFDQEKEKQTAGPAQTGEVF